MYVDTVKVMHYKKTCPHSHVTLEEQCLPIAAQQIHILALPLVSMIAESTSTRFTNFAPSFCSKTPTLKARHRSSTSQKTCCKQVSSSGVDCSLTVQILTLFPDCLFFFNFQVALSSTIIFIEQDLMRCVKDKHQDCRLNNERWYTLPWDISWRIAGRSAISIHGGFYRILQQVQNCYANYSNDLTPPDLTPLPINRLRVVALLHKQAERSFSCKPCNRNRLERCVNWQNVTSLTAKHLWLSLSFQTSSPFSGAPLDFYMQVRLLKSHANHPFQLKYNQVLHADTQLVILVLEDCNKKGTLISLLAEWQKPFKP